MSETAERIEERLRAGDCFGPRSPEQIHPSHDLKSIDDVGHCKVCHMLLEKTPPQNGHDIGKVFESIFKSLDSSGHFEGVGPGGMQAVWDGAQETLTRCDEDRSGD